MAGTELAKAYVQIVPSADGIKGKLTSALSGEASTAGDSAGKAAGVSLGSAIKKVIAAAGIGAALKSALSEGADLQQSLGGIETLFKDSADKVIANARNAYITAGLSANDYMESVTSFSASLLQGLAGDTNKAADVANMALTDMSDNANKMGTSMELIQNAYQGFAKSNYTMLDNLKLGYGGTKTEMERLLTDASKLSGVKYDIGNLADVYDAIHVIQGEMGISGRTAEEVAEIYKRTGREVSEQLGTTAKEAASTFSGSLASMKASASNLLGNLSLGEDIKPSMDALIKSTGTFLFDNLFPMVGNIITGLVDYIVDMAVNTDWGAVITQVLTTIRDTLSTTLRTYFGADTTLVNDMFGFLIDGVPVVIQTIQDGFSMLWEVCNNIWHAVGQPVWDVVLSAIQYVSDNWGSISETISTYFQRVCNFWQTVWANIGQPIWDMISFSLSSVAGLFAELMPDIMAFFQEAIAGIQDTWNNYLKPVFEAIGNVLNNYVKPAFELVFKAYIEPLVKNVFDGIRRLWNGTLKPVFDGICDFLLGVFTNDWKRSLQGVLNIATGIFNAIQVAIEKPMDFARDVVESAINFIKEKFDFSWSLPHLNLPHFTVSGSFSLNPLSVPSFGIDWYAKAMNDPMIMNSPTAFGINSLGQIMAGGEAGSEVISGTDTLMRMIAEAVASQIAGILPVLVKILEAITNLDENMSDNMRDGLSGTSLNINNREFARLVKAVT